MHSDWISFVWGIIMVLLVVFFVNLCMQEIGYETSWNWGHFREVFRPVRVLYNESDSVCERVCISCDKEMGCNLAHLASVAAEAIASRPG